jgi:tRNA (guanine-N7-)-methyltransferase
VENPNRTAAYRALLASRRNALVEQLTCLFPLPRDFVWELGSGHGHFLNAYAAAHPSEVCVGIDIIGERVERALRKRNRAQLANLAFFHAEARLFLDALPANVRIARTFILFPDPWPKVRHHKHRILQAEFLRQLASRSAPDARLHFRTDFAPYFEAARSTLAADPHWEIVSDVWPFEFETVFQSRASTHHSVTARRRP